MKSRKFKRTVSTLPSTNFSPSDKVSPYYRKKKVENSTPETYRNFGKKKLLKKAESVS